MDIDAKDIVHVQRVLHRVALPLRTAQQRLATWRERGGPVRRAPRPGNVGGYRLVVPLDAYCRSRNLDPAEVIAALGREAA